MDICRRRFNFIYDIDLFGNIPELYYKGKLKKTSWIGRFFTIAYFVIYIIVFAYKFIKMVQKKEITFYETYAYSGSTPSINITNENFYGGFALGKTPFIDETIYYPKVEYYKGIRTNGEWSWTYKNLEIGICKLEDFDERYHDLFREKPLNNLYCLKNLNLTLDGHSFSEIYSYFYVTIYGCINTTKDGIPCKPPEMIDYIFKKNVFQFYIQDIELTPQFYHSPIQVGQKIITGPIFKNLYKQFYTYMQIVNVETDQDFLGLNAFSRFKTQKFLQYDESWIVSAPIDENTYDKGYPLCEITIQLSDRVLTQKRTFVKLIEIFGDVGGSMEFIFTVFTIISSFLTRTLYRTALVNNIFSFDIEKKNIIIKFNKNNKDLKNNQIEPISKNPTINIIQDKTSDRKKLNKKKTFSETLLIGRTLKVPKRSSQKVVTNIPSYKICEINNISNKNLKNENISIKNTLNEFDFNNNNINDKQKKNEKNKSFINKIIINKAYFILCFICFKKSKNIKKYLLDEATKIIKDNLDIINIFKKLYREEKYFETLQKGDIIIKMSKECIKKLENCKK